MIKRFTFDTEDDSKGHPILFNFYNIETETHHTFENQLDALDFALSNEKTEYWAVNLEYDLNNLFRDHFALLSYCYAGSRMLSAESPEDSIKFLDTLNHWQLSVKRMGERIGMEKMEFDHTGSRVVTPRLIEYCRRDTEIAGRFLKRMISVYSEIGLKLRMTAASTTLDFFERKFHGRLQNPFTEEQVDFFHTGYYGGRTEIFYNNPIEGNIQYYDINSLYPWAMLNGVFPILRDFYETKSPNYCNEGIVECEIKTPELRIPYLPHRFENKLVFPTGIIRGVYTYFEIRQAIALGYQVVKVHRSIEFPGTFNPFAEFIETLYQGRLTAQAAKDDFMSLTYKNLMNFAYGKFAQKNESVKLVPLETTVLRGGDTLFGDLVFRKERIAYPRYANCVWACYVTAIARDRLYQSLCDVERRGGLLLYCDTDSIVYEHSESLTETSSDLGAFKLVGNYDYAHFKLPKLYSLRRGTETEYKTKGVPSKASAEFFNTGAASFQKPNKLRETLRRNLSPKRKEKLIPNYWDLRTKESHGRYDKRIVLKTGHTKPLTIGETSGS